METPDVSSGTFWAAVIAVVGSLAAAVRYLFSLMQSSNTKQLDALDKKVTNLAKRADDCENDREMLRIRIAVLEERHGRET